MEHRIRISNGSDLKIYFNFKDKSFDIGGSDCDVYSYVDLKRILTLCGINIDEPSLYNHYVNTFRIAGIDLQHYGETCAIHKNSLDRIYHDRIEILKNEYKNLKNSNLFVNAKNYYDHYGKTQYDLLYKMENIDILSGDKSYRFSYSDTRTGRLKCRSTNSRKNLYTMNLLERNRIRPKNKDYVLLYMDYVAAQFRLYLRLNNKDNLYQFYDPYDKIADIIGIDRHYTKLICLKFLFGRKFLNNKLINKISFIANGEQKFDNCYIGNYIYNYYGRPICITSEDHNIILVNVLQSLERDTLLNSMVAINNFISNNNLNSYLLFPFHDACGIALHKDEITHIPKIRNLFEESKICPMYSRMFVGNNMGNLKLVKDKRNEAICSG